MSRHKATLVLALMIALTSAGRADSTTEQVQRALKDQGFYYGDVTGRMDADTTAAIRRYQIRNGLKVTGELDAETQKSLRITAATPPKSTPKPRSSPPPPTPAPNGDEETDLRDDSDTEPAPQPAPRTIPDTGYPAGPERVAPDTSGLFADTPFEAAPPEVQERVIIGAQTLLARRGYYRSGIDGIYGPGMQFALRAFQGRIGLPPSGRLDMETLAALGLLPGQHGPGFPPRHRRVYPRRPPIEFAPDGEPIFIPR